MPPSNKNTVSIPIFLLALIISCFVTLFILSILSSIESVPSNACPVNKLTDYERNYPLILANIILGGGTDSKLFSEVREKNSSLK